MDYPPNTSRVSTPGCTGSEFESLTVLPMNGSEGGDIFLYLQKLLHVSAALNLAQKTLDQAQTEADIQTARVLARPSPESI